MQNCFICSPKPPPRGGFLFLIFSASSVGVFADKSPRKPSAVRALRCSCVCKSPQAPQPVLLHTQDNRASAHPERLPLLRLLPISKIRLSALPRPASKKRLYMCLHPFLRSPDTGEIRLRVHLIRAAPNLLPAALALVAPAAFLDPYDFVICPNMICAPNAQYHSHFRVSPYSTMFPRPSVRTVVLYRSRSANKPVACL